MNAFIHVPDLSSMNHLITKLPLLLQMLAPAQPGHSATGLGQPGMLPPQPGLSRWLFQLNLVTQQLALVSQSFYLFNQVSHISSSHTWPTWFSFPAKP